MLLDKYCGPGGIAILEHGSIFLTRPRAFNDPFDVSPHITKFDDPVEMGDHVFRKIKDIVVLSLAENCDSLLMWAHYAASHTGFSIGFEKDEKILDRPTPLFHYFDAVSYCHHRATGKRLPSLKDRCNVARVSALESVAAWGTASHRRAVKPLLTDSSPLVRAYAAWALGELGGRRVGVILGSRLAVERHPLPRTALHEVLFRVTGGDRHLQAVLRYLTSRSHRVSCFAAQSLRNCVNSDTRARIFGALQQPQRNDERVGVRETAGRVLEVIASKSAPHNQRLQPSTAAATRRRRG